ncbi:ABC transporter permease [Microtetraspora sp. NBRC 16547]|uniref:ABC transporter permease n=1 Tax=Microtetraspora sp. NBRC 16547 TaxID=3030993 RepID=UPI0024A39E5A|nr:ABC transporter permease [Microtetraspora sp. NBRC 16547]GLW96766.1 ABC transporter permease [Microtetraspora sp. NBRC 16547]
MGRLTALVTTLGVASVVIYGAMFIVPGDPATLLVGGSKPNPEALAAVRRQFHLDDPFWQSYLRWLSGAVRGDFGVSLVYRSPVSDLIASRALTTILLVAYAAIVIVIAGVGLGVLAAWKEKRAGVVITMATTVMMGAPTFVMAVIFVAVFATGLGWFPVFGAGSGLTDRLWHLTLPAFALAFSWIAYVAQVTRAAVRDEIRSEHVDTAHARGVPERLILRRHVLRNASGPILTVSGLTVAGLFAGTAVAEQAFGINGIGALLVESAAKQDLAIVQAISLVLVAAFVVVNMLVDLCNALLDPRAAGRAAR